MAELDTVLSVSIDYTLRAKCTDLVLSHEENIAGKNDL
jgi:hypothetical protein